MSQVELFPLPPPKVWTDGGPRVNQVLEDPERIRWRVVARVIRQGVTKFKLQAVDVERPPVTMEISKIRQIYRLESP